MDNSALLMTTISNKTIGYFAQYMNLARTVARDTDYEPAVEGETIKIGKRGALTANSKASGSDVNVQSPAATGTNVTLNNHYEVTIDLEDVTAAKQRKQLDIWDGYAQDAAMVLVEQVEDSIAALYSSISASAITFDATSTATKVNSILSLRKAFFDAKVPKNEEKFVYMGGNSSVAILEEERFTTAQNVGNGKAIVEGSIAKLLGFNLFEGQAVVSTGTTPSAVEHNIAYTKNAIVLAMRPLPLPNAGLGVVSKYMQDPNTGVGVRALMTYNGNKLAPQLTLDVLFGVAITDQRRIREFNLTY